VPSEVELAMGSRLQSNRATNAAKVDTLIPSAIFHSFQTGRSPTFMRNYLRSRGSELMEFPWEMRDTRNPPVVLRKIGVRSMGIKSSPCGSRKQPRCTLTAHG
jgi:hypothetical protein